MAPEGRQGQSGGDVIQTLAPAIGKARLPTVGTRKPERRNVELIR